MIDLSFSGASKWLESPFKWYAHYFLRLREVKQGSALPFGNAIDEALNEMLTPLDHSTKSLEKALKVFEEEWSKVDITEIRFSKADLDDSLVKGKEIPKGKNIQWVSLLEKGKMLIAAYHKDLLPEIKEVILVQHEKKIQNDSGDNFVLKIDLLARLQDNLVYLIDHKTSTITYKPDSVAESAQLGSYYELLKDDYQIDACAYFVLSKDIRKREPRTRTQIVKGQVKPEVIDKTFEDYEKVLHGIKTGVTHCSKGCLKSPFGCPYEKYCRSGGTDLTGLKILEKSKK